jgi:hypothetical protein
VGKGMAELPFADHENRLRLISSNQDDHEGRLVQVISRAEYLMKAFKWFALGTAFYVGGDLTWHIAGWLK